MKANAASKQINKATTPVVILGRQGCGKTRNAAALAAHYGKSVIIDDWLPGAALPPGALALTNEAGFPGAIPFAVAMREAGLECEPLAPATIREPYAARASATAAASAVMPQARQPYERFPGVSSANNLSSLSIKNRDSAVSSAAIATTSAAEKVSPSTESQIALAVTKRS